MTRAQLQAHEDSYLTATAYAKVLGCELSPVQYAAAVQMEPSEYDDWRLWLLGKGWGEEWLPAVLPSAEEQLERWKDTTTT
jgi:hypothetical protein